MAFETFFKYILERHSDVQVAAIFVVCVHPDVGDSAFVDEVPDLTHEVSLIMAEQRRRHADVGCQVHSVHLRKFDSNSLSFRARLRRTG